MDGNAHSRSFRLCVTIRRVTVCRDNASHVPLAQLPTPRPLPRGSARASPLLLRKHVASSSFSLSIPVSGRWSTSSALPPSRFRCWLLLLPREHLPHFALVFNVLAHVTMHGNELGGEFAPRPFALPQRRGAHRCKSSSPFFNSVTGKENADESRRSARDRLSF